MSWPFSASAAASCRVLFEVQRNGDSGSPRVAGSTRASRSLTRRGFVCLMDLRPPPGRRTRSETSRPSSSSPTAFCTVERDIPVASATLAMPPRPIARASAAATIRHWRSLRWGNTMASLDAKGWSGAATPPVYFLRAQIAWIIPLRALSAEISRLPAALPAPRLAEAGDDPAPGAGPGRLLDRLLETHHRKQPLPVTAVARGLRGG